MCWMAFFGCVESLNFNKTKKETESRRIAVLITCTSFVESWRANQASQQNKLNYTDLGQPSQGWVWGETKSSFLGRTECGVCSFWESPVVPAQPEPFPATALALQAPGDDPGFGTCSSPGQLGCSQSLFCSHPQRVEVKRDLGASSGNGRIRVQATGNRFSLRA